MASFPGGRSFTSGDLLFNAWEHSYVIKRNVINRAEGAGQFDRGRL